MRTLQERHKQPVNSEERQADQRSDRFPTGTSHERPHVDADIVRPEDESQDTFPEEGQVEKADRKEPPREPREGREAVVFDFDLFHRITCSSKVAACSPGFPPYQGNSRKARHREYPSVLRVPCHRLPPPSSSTPRHPARR